MYTYLCIFITSAVFIGTQSTAADIPPVVVNEVLANEPGSAVSLEWAELFNRSDMTVDLSSYVFIDAPDTTVLTGLVLAPAAYAVIARRVTADPGQDSYESLWGDGSGVWGDAEGENYPVLEVKMKLRNTTDTVEIRGSLGETSTMWWIGDAGDGTSWERLRPDSPNIENSFSPCADPGGSTPGRINSHTPRPNDLAIDSSSIAVLPNPPRENEVCTLLVTVENVGLGLSQSNVITIGDDTNFDDEVGESEILSTYEIPTLAEGQSSTAVCELLLNGGVHRLIVMAQSDGNMANNRTEITFKVMFALPEIVINEYLADPPPGGSEEWIELYNRSGEDIDLQGWLIGDSVGQSLIADESLIIPAGGFLIACDNMAAFLLSYPDVGNIPVIEIGSWRALNNTGDRIVILDNYGFVVDSLTYAMTYGNGRSTERIDSERASGASDNWWGSVDPQGATPGKVNSTSVSFTENLQVNVSPNPFRRGELIEIDYSVPFKSNLTVRIYDVNGREMITLVNDRPVASGTIQWDGSDADGKALPPGVYVLFFETDRGVVKKIPLAVSPSR